MSTTNRLMIKKIEINTEVTIALIVRSASARKTGKGKPFLTLDLFDGKESIVGNFWDWSSGIIPANNCILNVYASVSSYNNNKQLNIKGLTNNTDLHPSAFMPSSDNNVSDIYKEAYNLASSISDWTLRELTLSALENEKLFSLWQTVPGAKTVHHAYLAGTLVHSLSVAKLSKALAEQVEGANVDLCIAGGLLHDVGKLLAYKLDGAVIDMTDEGMLFEHIQLGSSIITELASALDPMPAHCQDKISILKHIILSHHGRLEYGSPVTPQCIEAYIVSKSDALDAAAEQIRVASRDVTEGAWTNRLWALDNRPHLSCEYINKLLTRDEDRQPI